MRRPDRIQLPTHLAPMSDSSMSLGISTNLEAVTAQYVDVRLERKKAVLETYHKALHPQKTAPEKDEASKDPPKKTKKRSSGIEL